MSIYELLIIFHIIGTVLGVGGATFAEIFHVRALRDGSVSEEEGATLKAIYTILRIGLFTAVLSGFGFLLYFSLTGQEERLYSEKLWAKLTVIFFLSVNALLLQAKKMPLWLGSSVSLTSWYTALILGSVWGADYTYFGVLSVYIVAVLVVAGLLHLIEKRFRH